MRLRFRITRKDAFGASLQALLWQRILLVILFVVFAAAWWNTFTSEAFARFSLNVRVLIATSVSLLTAMGGILAFVAISAIQTLLMKENQGTLGEHTLEITREGLVESTEVNRSVANWGTPFRIRQSSRYGFIYVSANQAHIIPKLTPALEGSPQEFLDELQKRISTRPPQP